MSSANKREAVVLVGGFGTRLRSIVSSLPKPLAPIAGRSFLLILLNQLRRNQFERVVLSTGYMADKIREAVADSEFRDFVEFSHEDTPLGTGGATLQALKLITQENFFLFNGDTFFDVDLDSLLEQHIKTQADVTIALKTMEQTERYGTVELSGTRIVGFREKSQQVGSQLVNGGIYCMRKSSINPQLFPPVFSLEEDLFEAKINSLNIVGFISSGYFIDIGNPIDYERAQRELPRRV